MKIYYEKVKILFAFSIVLLMFLSITNVNATENVKIKSIDLVDKSVNASETSKATFDGLTMNFNIRFLSVDDYAKYKVVVENNESSDYKISVDSEFNNSKYITYEYEKTDSLKANSESEFYVTVTYKNKVSDSDLVNDKYTEKNSAVLKLSNGNINNPNTSNNMIMIVIGLLVVSTILFVLFKSSKNKKANVLVLLSLLSIPLFVKAVDSLKITINSNASIEKGYYVGYEVHGYIKASDISNYDLSYAKLLTYVYVGSVSEENKYLLYDYPIYKGQKLYSFGEAVNFNYDSISIYKFNSNYCDAPDKKISTYEGFRDLEPGSICETPEKLDASHYLVYHYAKDDLTYFGYKYNEDDNTVMKFSNATDNWQDGGKIIPNDGSTFIMPKHNILFTLDD